MWLCIVPVLALVALGLWLGLLYFYPPSKWPKDKWPRPMIVDGKLKWVKLEEPKEPDTEAGWFQWMRPKTSPPPEPEPVAQGGWFQWMRPKSTPLASQDSLRSSQRMDAKVDSERNSKPWYSDIWSSFEQSQSQSQRQSTLERGKSSFERNKSLLNSKSTVSGNI